MNVSVFFIGPPLSVGWAELARGEILVSPEGIQGECARKQARRNSALESNSNQTLRRRKFEVKSQPRTSSFSLALIFSG